MVYLKPYVQVGYILLGKMNILNKIAVLLTKSSFTFRAIT